MKKLLLFTFISTSVLGQSIEINPNNSSVSPNALIKKEGIGFEHTNGTVRMGTYVNNYYGATFQTHSNHLLAFATNDDLRQVVLNTDGKFGIGFDLPAYWLDVKGRARIKHYKTSSIDETAGIWYNKSDNTEGAFAGMFNDDIYGLFGMGTVSNWKFGFDLLNTKMGIGTMTPKHPLTFQSAAGDKISFSGGNYSASNYHYGIGIQPAALQLYIPTSGENIVFGTGRSGDFTENMRITGTGNVGIGTNNPISKLHVYATGAGLVHSNDDGLKLATFLGTGIAYLGTVSNHPLAFFVNDGIAAFKITTDERFQFGNKTLPTGYKMSVDGQIICTDITTLPTSSWPDYVFKSDYKLKPLSDVERFIQANGHLPNIPKATEIESKGVALGDMSKLQMEKIEELTLYLIEMNKTLIETNKRLQKVEEENERLKKELIRDKSQN